MSKFSPYRDPDMEAADAILEFVMWESNNVYEDLDAKQRLKICREIAHCLRHERKRSGCCFSGSVQPCPTHEAGNRRHVTAPWVRAKPSAEKEGA